MYGCERAEWELRSVVNKLGLKTNSIKCINNDYLVYISTKCYGLRYQGGAIFKRIMEVSEIFFEGNVSLFSNSKTFQGYILTCVKLLPIKLIVSKILTKIVYCRIENMAENYLIEDDFD